jgi:hypothetical protein
MYSENTIDLQVRWIVRKLGLDAARARLIAGIAFETTERRS